MKSHYQWSITAAILVSLSVIWYTKDITQQNSATISNNLATRQAILFQGPINSHSENNSTIPIKPDNTVETFNNNIPKYLEGTAIRGDLPILTDGSLLISVETRKLFDYFYMMIGDLNSEEINSIIVDHIQQQLSEPALSQALTLFQQYSDYLNEYNAFNQELDMQTIQNDPQWVASEIHNIRKFHLGEETSKIFFGQQEMLRNNYLQQNDNPLSDRILENQNKTLLLTNLQKETALLKADHSDSVDIYNMRVERAGKDAADRLTQLDKDRQQWQITKQAYKDLKTEWNDSKGLTDKDKEISFENQAKEILNLTDVELKRLQAIHYIQSKHNG